MSVVFQLIYCVCYSIYFTLVLSGWTNSPMLPVHECRRPLGLSEGKVLVPVNSLCSCELSHSASLSTVTSVHAVTVSLTCGIKWYRFISVDEVQCQTNRPLLTEIVEALRGSVARITYTVLVETLNHAQLINQSIYLSLFVHMDYNILLNIFWLSWLLWTGRDCWDNLEWPEWRWYRTTSTPTGCHGLKQLNWARTDQSGGCWRLLALHTHSGASQRWQWEWTVAWVVGSRANPSSNLIIICPASNHPLTGSWGHGEETSLVLAFMQNQAVNVHCTASVVI